MCPAIKSEQFKWRQTVQQGCSCMGHVLIQNDTKKNGDFWKTQQKLKKSKKKNLLTEIEPLQLAF